MKKILTGLLSCAALFFSGCGYHMGSIMHPDVSTIAIGNCINETTAYNVSVQLQQLLSEQFMLDGSLKVVSRSKADAIIFCRILDIGYVEIAGRNYGNDNVYRPDEWQVKVNIEYSVIIPSQKEPLVGPRMVYGITLFKIQADTEVARERAIIQACRDAAQKIVQETTEGW